MFNGGSQSVVVVPSEKSAEGVSVEITSSEGSYQSNLPATIVTASSYTPIEAKVIDECYQPSIAKVQKTITPSFFANLLNGVGFLVDLATGMYWKYDSRLMVVTDKKSSCEDEAEDEGKAIN